MVHCSSKTVNSSDLLVPDNSFDLGRCNLGHPCIIVEKRWSMIQSFSYFLVSAEQVPLLYFVLQPLLQLGNLTFLLLQLAA